MIRTHTIATRRPLRLAGAAPARPPAATVRPFRPALRLQWRRAVAAAGIGAGAARPLPDRPANWFVTLRQHLHLHIGAARPLPPDARRDRAVRGFITRPMPSLRPAAAPGVAMAMAMRRPGAARRPRELSLHAVAPPRSGNLALRCALFAGAGGTGRLVSQVATPARAAASVRATVTRFHAAPAQGARPHAVDVHAAPGRKRVPALPGPRRSGLAHRAEPAQAAAPGARPPPRAPAALRALARQRTTPPPAAAAARQAPLAAPPALALEWRRASSADADAGSGPAPWLPVVAAPAAVRPSTAAAASHAAPPAFMRMQSGGAGFDAAALDRFADDVVKRVERRLRIERERRGIHG